MIPSATKRGSKNARFIFLLRQRPLDQLATYLMNSSMVYVYLREVLSSGLCSFEVNG
jgi:hypothetical protein